MDQKWHSIVVADLQPIAAEGVRALMAGAGEFQFVEAVQSLPAALDAVRRDEPSILLLDKGFGLQEVIQFLAEMQTFGRRTSTVVWGATISEAEVLRLVQAGASGIVRKSEDLERFLACLRAVAAGGAWVPGALPTAAQGQASTRLTLRERQVADLVFQGLRNREIALRLGMQPGTVKVHLKHIFEKTGIRGRYALALSCLQEKPKVSTASC